MGVVLKERLERVLVTSCPLHVATGDGCSHTPEQLVGDRAQTLRSTQGSTHQGVQPAQLDLGHLQ